MTDPDKVTELTAEGCLLSPRNVPHVLTEQGKLFILGMKSLPLGLESGLHLESVHARHCVLKR
jgi:hypothetical protein